MNPQQSNKLSTDEIIDELRHIQEQMLGLLDEALDLLRYSGFTESFEEAETTWIADIKVALTRDHDYLDGGMCSLEDTIESIEEESQN